MDDGRVEADEAELVDVGFHVYAATAVGGEGEQIIKAPEGRPESVADTFLTAAGEGIRFVDAIADVMRAAEVLYLGQAGIESIVVGEETIQRCVGVSRAAAIVVMRGQLHVGKFGSDGFRRSSHFPPRPGRRKQRREAWRVWRP